MDLALKHEIGVVPDLRHRIRQMRWFKTFFRSDARRIAETYGFVCEIDDRLLTEAFLNWAEAFAASKEFARLDRRDFVIFTAGLLLRELLRTHPATLRARPGAKLPIDRQDGSASIAQAWPEGFLYTNYCLCVLTAVLEQEGMTLTLPALADDLRTWYSYRENVGEDPAQAIAFLDLFTGTAPNWFMPDAVSSRAAMQRASEARVVPSAPPVARLAS